MSFLDQAIEATQSNTGRVVSSQHDPNQIKIELPDFDGNLANSIAAIKRQYSWDADEYGITMEEAIARLVDADTAEGRQEVIEDIRRRAIRRADLDVSTGEVAMLSVGQTPWHELGTVWDGPITVEQACREAKMSGWNMTLEPSYVKLDGKDVETGGYCVVRRDTNIVLARDVSQLYKIVTNEEAFAFLDDVLDDIQIETAGSIRNGRQTWISARLPKPIEVAGDEVLTYAMFSSRNDGQGAIKCYPTAIRTVCANTKRVADQSATRALSIRHKGDIKSKVEDAKRALGVATEQLDQFGTVSQELARRQIEPVEYFHAVLDDVINETIAGERVTQAHISGGDVLKAILDMPEAGKADAEKRYERVVRRREKMFESIMGRYESDRNNGNPAIEGSAWAAWNAVTEEQDHGRRYKGTEQERKESRFTSVMSGASEKIKQSSLELAMEISQQA